MRTSRIIPALGAAFALAGTGCKTGTAAGGERPSYQESRTETLTAKVEAIDHKTRQVTLRGPEGKTVSFVASDEVRNLAQVEVGDQVKVEYLESIAIEVRPSDGSQPDAGVAAAAGRAEPGQKPAGVAAREVTLTASVEAVDRENGTVTVRGPLGNLRVVKVKDPKNLERLANVKVGDQVVLTYTEALAVSVEEVPAR